MEKGTIRALLMDVAPFTNAAVDAVELAKGALAWRKARGPYQAAFGESAIPGTLNGAQEIHDFMALGRLKKTDPKRVIHDQAWDAFFAAKNAADHLKVSAPGAVVGALLLGAGARLASAHELGGFLLAGAGVAASSVAGLIPASRFSAWRREAGHALHRLPFLRAYEAKAEPSPLQGLGLNR